MSAFALLGSAPGTGAPPAASCTAQIQAMAGERKFALGAPLTVSLPVTAAQMRRHAACAQAGALSLTIAGTRLVFGQSGGVMVFVNKDDATAATSPSDPHFAGAFDFFPADGPPQNIDVNLSAAFARSVDPNSRKVSITLVALPHPSGKGPPPQISLGTLRLEAKPAKR